MDYNTHQDKTNTGINRYPEIFKFCFDINPNPFNILSYGCSSGEEVETLAMFFGTSNIYGVDINEDMINQTRLKFKYINRIKTSKEIIKEVKYDFIFCMSVLCRWPDTEKIEDCSNTYNFEKFNTTLNDLDKQLMIGGYLVIYNSNFIFDNSDVSDNYISVGNWKESGFVHKFTNKNLKTNLEYTKCVFRKTK